MKRSKKRLLSLLLTLCMMLSMFTGLGVTASAAEGAITTWAELQNAFTNGGEITLTQDITASSSDAKLAVPAGKTVTLDLNGHAINRNLTSATYSGNVIDVSGTLIVNDSGSSGTITGGYSKDNTYDAGAVCVKSGGSFTLNGGGICRNRTSGTNYGTGVIVQNNATFTMNGGSIHDNISGWTGGGVGAAASATVTLLGGSIVNNTAAQNSGGLNSYGSNVIVGGTIVIKNNIAKSATNNVRLVDRNYLLLSTDTPLQEGAEIGWTTNSEVQAGAVVAKGANAARYTKFFFADKSAELKIGVKTGDAETIYVAPQNSAEVTEPSSHSVTITAGEHMTKTADSGDASQAGLPGAMTDVVYTADNGYYFPEDYVSSITGLADGVLNGITVTRNSDTQITVSGTPTADTTITLPEAEVLPLPTFSDGLGKTDCAFDTYTKGQTNDEGYTFTGWFNGNTELESADAAVAGTTYTAKWTKNGKTVRTQALDFTDSEDTPAWQTGCTENGTLWTNAAEKWSWDTATKQLTLFGLNLVADSFLPLNLPDGAEIILAAGTENSIRSSSAPIEMGITLIRGEGALTISGSGKLTVGSGTDNPATTFAIAVMNDLTINLTGAGQVTALGAVGNARPDLPTAAIISLMGSIVLGDDVIIAEPAGTSIQTVQGMQLTADQSGSPVTGVVLRTGSAANMIKHLSVHIDELKPGPLSRAKITITGSADMPATSPASFQAENVVWYVVPEDGGKLQKATEFEAGKTYAPGFTFRFDPSTTPFPEADQEHTIRDTSVYVYYKNQLLSFDLAETPYLTPLDQNTMGLELPLVFVASSGDAPTEHTITFDTQGGDPLPGGSTAKTVGGKLAALPTPTQTGKYFAGWYTELLGGQLVTEKTVFTAPAIIYARWTIAKIEHTTQPDSNALQGAVAMTDLEVLDKIPLTDAEKNGTDDINIYLNVQDINQTIPTAEKDIITGKAGSDTVASYLDITLFKQVGSSAPAPIPNTNGKITVSLTVPDAFINANAGVTRTYYIIYVHGGAVQTLPASFDAATKRLSFETEQFSTYALAYQDVSGGSSGGNAGGGGAVAATSPVNIPATTRGKVSTNPKTASKGQTVTITATPEDGYTLDTLTVTDKDGNKLPVTAVGGGKYTSTMPEGAVSIAASFKAASAEGWKLGYQNCPLDEACPLWPYTDVKSSDWYHDGVHFCMENGLMNGYSDGSFKPAANTTRAMIATILYRLEGAPAVSGTAFSDVAAGAYYHDAVLWAQANGVVKGYGDGTFGPDNAVTREQMAAILHRYAQYKGYDVSVGENTNILSYGDAERVEEYAIPAMQWACGAGVVTGKQGVSGLNLDPKGSTTRAEMATMMMRFCAEIIK